MREDLRKLWRSGKGSIIAWSILIALTLGLLLITINVAALQYGRPDGDVTIGGWTDGGSAEVDGILWNSIDEATPDDATSYIRATSASSTSEVSLSDVTDPEVSTGHIMRFRAYATGGGGAERLTMSLYQGATSIASTGLLTITRGSWNTYTYTLTGAEADSITDYTDLRKRFAPTALAGSDTIDVTWAELETPDPPLGEGCEALTVDVADPSGQIWFNGTTDTPSGGLWQEENVTASFQTDSTPAINVTNDDSGDDCGVTLTLLSDPGSGRTAKYNTTNVAPNPGANSIPISPTNVTVVSGLGPGATQTIWLWVDYQDSQGGSISVSLRVDTKLSSQ